MMLESLRGLSLLCLLLGASAAAQNTSPRISNIPDLNFPVADLTVTTNFTVSDSESAAEELTLTGRSSNTNLVPDDQIVFAGVGSNRTVTISRVSDRLGTATITITVTDPQGASGGDTFKVGIEHFSLAASRPLGSKVAAADYDDDGDLDVLTPSKLCRNDGGLAFSNVPVAFGINYLLMLAWGDYNNDGYLDCFLAGEDPLNRPASRLLRNNGNGTFSTNLTAGLPGAIYGAAAWGDFNNDGRLDLLVAASTNSDYAGRNMTRIYRNNGDQTFTDILLSLPGVELSSVAWGDFDNDGHLDFALAGGTFKSSGHITRIYRNQGDDTFLDIAAGFPGLIQGSVAWGDYDNDGLLDLLLTGNMGSVGSAIPVTRLYHNHGDGTFSAVDAGLPSLSSSSCAWGDFDND